MDVRRKLEILADAAKFDASCASSGARRGPVSGGIGHTDGTGICHSYTPDGRCVSLLKILLTNYCIFDCLFCQNRLSSDIPRARFTVQEVVDLTLEFYRRNYIEGLFLSSGVIQSPDYTMELLIDVARRLRVDHRFNGYIHLKTMPSAAQPLLDEAGRWADRLSVNIELPTQADLDRLAPEKRHAAIEGTMGQVKARVVAATTARAKSPRAPRYAPAGQSTQLVVGATDTPDAQIIATAARLYERHDLRRVYYSAFSPIPRADRVLPSRPPALAREHRLYQADWLLRFYGFGADELTTTAEPNLALDIDPKLGWALRNRERFPVDVNVASREQLLRVPGLGHRTVTRLLDVRRHHRIRLRDLQLLRARLPQARPFIVAADWKPSLGLLDSASLRERLRPAPTQSSLFEDLATPA